jgi:hypothetical protein
MKTLASLIAFFLLLLAGSVPAQLFYPSENLKVEWKAATDALPKKLWIYKSIPQNFSAAVISNAMALASFKTNDFAGSPDNEPTALLFYDHKGQFWTRSLDIMPRVGQIAYRVQGDLVGPAQGVPREEQIKKQAWDYVVRLGIDRAQLVEKAVTTQNCERDKTGKEFTNGICAREMHLARRVEGIEMRDFGFWLRLGKQAELRMFSLLWPGLDPFESHSLASTEQINKWIKEAKVYMALEDDGTFDMTKCKELSKANKLTITKIIPIYAEGDVRKYGQVPKDSDERMFSPYAELEGVAELGSKTMNCRLLCPILAMEIGKPVDVLAK